MTPDYIYTPVLQQTKLDDIMDALSDFYFGNAATQFVVELSCFIIGMATIAALVFVAVA